MKQIILTLSAAALAAASLSASAWWQAPGVPSVDELRQQHQAMADRHAKAVEQMREGRGPWTAPWPQTGMAPGRYGPVGGPASAFGWQPPPMPQMTEMPQVPEMLSLGAMPPLPEMPEMPAIGEYPKAPGMVMPEPPALPEFNGYPTPPDSASEDSRAERKARLEGRRQQARAETDARREALRKLNEERRWMNRMRRYGYGYMPMPARFMPMQQECAPAPTLEAAAEQPRAAPLPGGSDQSPSAQGPDRVSASGPTSAQVN